MNSDNDKQYLRIKKAPLMIVLLVLGAGLLGWWLGQSDSDTQSTSESTNATTKIPTFNNDTAVSSDVRSFVVYRLPDGWKEASCPNSPSTTFVIPAGAHGVGCDENPSSPIKISIDPSNSDDCNDLQNVQNVSKHICISLFINGKKSLKAETIYNKDSSYKKDTAINTYYINTGKGVIKVEYIHGVDNNEYQIGLDQIAMSVQVK